MPRRRRLGILTGGGDCPGLNAVIRAVVLSAAAGLRAGDGRGRLEGASEVAQTARRRVAFWR
jgi:hypothetical protein